MKKGKTVKLNGYRSFKSQFGTIDATNLKSIFLNIQTWVEPKEEVENWNRVILNMTRNVKHSVLENINKQTFDTKFIVDLDLRTSGIQLKKKSFMNLEITLYVNKQFDIKTKDIKNSIKNILESIIDEGLNDKKLFNFNKSKK
jgi:hypothetical protein